MGGLHRSPYSHSRQSTLYSSESVSNTAIRTGLSFPFWACGPRTSKCNFRAISFPAAIIPSVSTPVCSSHRNPLIVNLLPTVPSTGTLSLVPTPLLRAAALLRPALPSPLHWNDTPAAPCTATTAAPHPDTHRCSSDSVHNRDESDVHTHPTGRSAPAGNRRVLHPQSNQNEAEVAPGRF